MISLDDLNFALNEYNTLSFDEIESTSSLYSTSNYNNIEDDHHYLLEHRKNLINKKIENYSKDRLNTEKLSSISQILLEKNELSYDLFCTLKEIAPKNAKKYFTAKVFFFFLPCENGCINSSEFVNYMERSLMLEENLLQMLTYTNILTSNDKPILPLPPLSINTSSNTSSLVPSSHPINITPDQLEQLIYTHYLPLIDTEHIIVEDFLEFYLSVASSAFSFSLGSKLPYSLRSLIHSDPFLELQRLIQLKEKEKEEKSKNYDYYDLKIDENWFSTANAINIYNTYLELDKDKNGLLTVEELMNFYSIIFSNNSNAEEDSYTFTALACSRIFDLLIENFSTPYELDFLGFSTLVYLLRDVKRIKNYSVLRNFNEASNQLNQYNKLLKVNPSLLNQNSGVGVEGTKGLYFLWKLVDFDNNNCLSPYKINFFYQSLVERLPNWTLPTVDVFIAEIYDLLGYYYGVGDSVNEKIYEDNNVIKGDQENTYYDNLHLKKLCENVKNLDSKIEDLENNNKNFNKYLINYQNNKYNSNFYSTIPSSSHDFPNNVGPTWQFMLTNAQAKTVLFMLLDANAYYLYDSRESL